MSSKSELTLNYRGKQLPCTVDEAIQLVESLGIMLSHQNGQSNKLKSGDKSTDYFTTTSNHLADC